MLVSRHLPSLPPQRLAAPLLSAPLPFAAAPPLAAASPPVAVPATLDTVSPPANPWPALARAGFLGAGSATPGPLAAVVDEATRNDLLASLRRLEGAGYHFERSRPVYIPGLMDRNVPLSAQEALDLLTASSGPVKDLHVVTPLGAQEDLDGLPHLQALDAVDGIGEAAVPGREAVLRATRGLASSGCTFSVWAGERWVISPSAPLWAFDKGLEVVTDLAGRAAIRDAQSLLALDYFEGSKMDHGLDQPALPHALRAAVEDGLRLADGGGRDLSPYAALMDLTRWGRTVRVSLPQQPGLRVDAHAFDDLPALRARVQAAGALYDRVARADMERAYVSSVRNEFLDAVMSREKSVPPEEAASLLCSLAVAEKDAGGWAGAAMERAAADLDAICEQAAHPSERRRWTDAFVSILREGGLEEARGFVRDGRALATKRAGYEADHVTDLLLRLAAASGSTQVALEGADLVRIPVDGEAEEDRAAVFTELARRGGLDAASSYRLLLVHRLPRESLRDVAATCGAVHDVLAARGQVERAGEVFARVQYGVGHGLVPHATPAAVGAFAQAFALGGSVDDALAAMAREPQAGGTIDQRDGEIVIGGIRVPRTQSR